MKDSYGRIIDYMRISITDRCNLRCRYCMPEGISQVPMEEILTYEEIEELCRAASELGISRLKITGGEPLVRSGCPRLIGMLKKIPGIEQVTMTTNGTLLKQYLPQLLDNGLDAVNISLDTLNPQIYQQITGKNQLHEVLAGIGQALKAGLTVKLNAVLQPGINSKEWLSLARLTTQYPLDVRFIEMMPIGCGRSYRPVSNQELLLRLKASYPDLRTDESIRGNGPAVYYRIPRAMGSVGFISALHGKFCSGCNRLRLTAQGKLKPCLCFEEEVDVMEILRGKEKKDAMEVLQEKEDAMEVLQEKEDAMEVLQEKEDTMEVLQEKENSACREVQQRSNAAVRKELLKQRIAQAVSQKPREHHFETAGQITERRQMAQIGG